MRHLELQLHGGDRLTRRRLCELLDVGVQVARRHLGVAAGGGLEQGLVDEDVLVLGLHHVVPLGAHARHVAVDVHRFLVLHALQHGVDHDEAAGSAHASAEGETGKEGVGGGGVGWDNMFHHLFDYDTGDAVRDKSQ